MSREFEKSVISRLTFHSYGLFTFTFFKTSGDASNDAIDDVAAVTFRENLLSLDELSRAQVSGDLGMVVADLRNNYFLPS